LQLGGCQSQVRQLPNSGLLGLNRLAAAKLRFGSAAKLWFGGCQTWVWQLPNQSFGNERLSLLMLSHYIRSVSMYFAFGFAIPLLSWHLVTLVQSMMK